jgi:hypothetical protein
LITRFAGPAGVESGKVVGSQRFERRALHEVQTPRLGVLGARGAAGGLGELADRVHRHEFRRKLADGAAGVHGFEGV